MTTQNDTKVQEYNLSSKVFSSATTSPSVDVRDIKEFIERLKAKRNNGDFIHIRDLNKLIGEEFK